MLYSEATGQKMPLSAATPYAGSLVEQGGSLYQQASFQNNAWHTYASNLPTLGGIVGGTYPTPGGPNTAPGGGTTICAEHQRPAHHAGVRDGPVHGGAGFQLRPDAAGGQHAGAGIDGGVIRCLESQPSRAQRRDAGVAVHRVHGAAGVRATPEPVSRRDDPAVAARADLAPDVPAQQAAERVALSALYGFWVVAERRVDAVRLLQSVRGRGRPADRQQL